MSNILLMVSSLTLEIKAVCPNGVVVSGSKTIPFEACVLDTNSFMKYDCINGQIIGQAYDDHKCQLQLIQQPIYCKSMVL